MCSCCKRPSLDPETVMLTTLVIDNSPCGTTTQCLEVQIHTSQPSEPAITFTLVKAVCSKRPTEVPPPDDGGPSVKAECATSECQPHDHVRQCLRRS